MLQNFLKPKLQDLDNNSMIWFQQDGATAHTAKNSMDVLRDLFPSYLISLRGDIDGQHAHQIFLYAITFCGVIIKAEVYNIS